MSDETQLVPPPAIIQERLARNIQEGMTLRSLLRVSIQAEKRRRVLEESLQSRQTIGGAR